MGKNKNNKKKNSACCDQSNLLKGMTTKPLEDKG